MFATYIQKTSAQIRCSSLLFLFYQGRVQKIRSSDTDVTRYERSIYVYTGHDWSSEDLIDDQCTKTNGRKARERMTDIVFDPINSFNVIIRYAIEKICSLSSVSFSMRLGNKYLVSDDSSEKHFD